MPTEHVLATPIVAGLLTPSALGQVTQRVGVDSSGSQADQSTSRPSITALGTQIAFESAATNLVPGDTNGAPDVFVHDRALGRTTRVSLTSAGAESDGPSSDASISADGRCVAFWSEASDLIGGDTNGVEDAFLRDRSAAPPPWRPTAQPRRPRSPAVRPRSRAAACPA